MNAIFIVECDSTGWKNCKIRAWINDEFLNDAFNLKEQSLIKDTVNQNELIPAGDITGKSAEKVEWTEQYIANLDSSTIDKVFILSKAEIEKYFPTDESRRCAITKYLYKFFGGDISASIRIDDKPTGAYFTRSCNAYAEIDTYDNTTKNFYSVCIFITPEGNYSSCYGIANGIRPAMWISTN